MYTFRKSKIKLKNIINITDKNRYIFKGILIISILLILISILYASATNGNKETLSDGINIKLWYSKIGHLWQDRLFDSYLPLLTSIIISAAFYRDYESNIYEIITYYNKGRYNICVFLRWALYTFLILISTFIAIIIQYIGCLESSVSIFMLIVRFFPPVLFMSSLSLAITVIFKNPLLAGTVTLIYVILDVFSGGRLFKIFTLLGNSFALNTSRFFYMNRFILVVFSIIFVYIGSRKSTEV